MSNKINPATNAPYNIYDRIVHMCDLEKILDSSLDNDGMMYKWDKNRSRGRDTKLGGDYVLVVPSKNKSSNKYNDEEFHYFFMGVINKDELSTAGKQNNIPIKLKIISAFADRENLVVGLGPRHSILEISKKDVASKATIFTKTRPSYQQTKSSAISQSNSIASSIQSPTAQMKKKTTNISFTPQRNQQFNDHNYNFSSQVIGATDIALPPPMYQLPQFDLNTIIKTLENLNEKITNTLQNLTNPFKRSQEQPSQDRTAYGRKINLSIPFTKELPKIELPEALTAKSEKNKGKVDLVTKESFKEQLRSATKAADEFNQSRATEHKDKTRNKDQSL